MLYFENKDGFITKYEVCIQEEKLEDLRSRIITNCSHKTHILEERTTNPGDFMNPNKGSIILIAKNHTGKVKSYSDTSEDVVVYDYDYIRVSYPMLVSLISELISGNEDAIECIIQDYKVETPINYDELINAKKEEVKSLTDSNPKKAAAKINELLALQEEKGLNKNQVSTAQYYKELLSYINLKYLDKLPLEELLSFNIFFEVNEDLGSIKLLRKKEKTSKH